MLNTNDVLENRYRIVRLLGQGGMGAVYEAIDDRFGEPIALKEVRFESDEVAAGGQLELMKKAFEREAKSLAKARHEVVPYVRDYFFEQDRQYLVMELVQGDDLGRLLAKRDGPFPPDTILDWMLQILDALDYLHTMSPPIIHRDIKPENLKITDRGRVKLLDFGIAKSIESGDFTITNQTFVGATLNYSPIEQILRVLNPTFRDFICLKHQERAEKVLHQATDARSDIYAFGATFYHLVTDKPPTDVVKRTLDVWEGRGDPLPAPADVHPDVPASLSRCLMHAMEIDRDDRYGSAAEMIEDLHSEFTPEWSRSFHVSVPHLSGAVQAASPTGNGFAEATRAETEVMVNAASVAVGEAMRDAAGQLSDEDLSRAETERVVTADEIRLPADYRESDFADGPEPVDQQAAAAAAGFSDVTPTEAVSAAGSDPPKADVDATIAADIKALVANVVSATSGYDIDTSGAAVSPVPVESPSVTRENEPVRAEFQTDGLAALTSAETVSFSPSRLTESSMPSPAVGLVTNVIAGPDADEIRRAVAETDEGTPFETASEQHRDDVLHGPEHDEFEPFSYKATAGFPKLLVLVPVGALALLIGTVGLVTLLWSRSGQATESVVPASNASVPAAGDVKAAQPDATPQPDAVPAPASNSGDIVSEAPDIVQPSAPAPRATPKPAPSKKPEAKKAAVKEKPSDDCILTDTCG
jgi:serine/threonine protein kinase